MLYRKKISASLESFKRPKNAKVVACPFVFRGGTQYHEMGEDRPWLKKVMELLGSKPYYIFTEDGKYFVTDTGPKTITLKSKELP